MRRCAIMGQSSLCAALAKNTGWGQGILWFLDLRVSSFISCVSRNIKRFFHLTSAYLQARSQDVSMGESSGVQPYMLCKALSDNIEFVIEDTYTCTIRYISPIKRCARATRHLERRLFSTSGRWRGGLVQFLTLALSFKWYWYWDVFFSAQKEY